MNSIRKRLLLLVLSALAAGTLLFAVVMYYSLRLEMDELFDENMKQMAESLSAQGYAETDIWGQPHKDSLRAQLSGEDEFLIQIWKKHGLEYSSLPAIDFPYHHRRGFGTVSFRRDKWRYYVLRRDEWSVQIAQDLHQRHGVIREIQLNFLLPVLLEFAVIAFLIWFSVGYALDPLVRLSRMIRARTPAYLDPLPEGDVPDEISSMVAALNDLLARLRDSIAMQGRFTANAAHELRSPLTAVKLQLDLLSRADTVEERAEAFNALQKGVERSMRLVGQLLELARQQPEAAQNYAGSVDLNAIVREAIEGIELVAKHKEISLQFMQTREREADIYGDATAIGVLAGNLINNAVLYTQPGGKVIVRILAPAGQRVIMDVADNGPGIPEAERPRIFDRFYRLSGSSAAGSGLGLSIVRQIADRSGAEITLHDGIDGKGVSFRVSFQRVG
jgi:signal transduction histidine kinase